MLAPRWDLWTGVALTVGTQTFLSLATYLVAEDKCFCLGRLIPLLRRREMCLVGGVSDQAGGTKPSKSCFQKPFS